MSNYEGLKYIGNSKFGVSLMLYNSYKKVDILPSAPYYFQPNDDTTPEAIAFYKKIKVSAGVELFSKINDTTETNTDITSDTVNNDTDDKEITDENVTDKEVTDKEVTDKDNDYIVSDNTIEDTDKEVLDSKVVPTGNEVDINSLNDSELSEYIEMNYSRDYIKSMISEITTEYSVGNKRTNTVISDILSTNKNEVVSYLDTHKS